MSTRRAWSNPPGRIPGLLVALLGVPVALASCGDDPPATEEPAAQLSVILISIDTLRRDHVGFYGYERDTTPNLDALARESLVFDRCYTTMSWTLIAHMSLLTGLYPSQHKVWDKQAVLSKSAPTLQERLSEQGYYTMGFYFPGWLDPRYGFGRGFDVYEPHRDAEEAEDHMRAAMAARPTDRPFFLFVHLFDVHNAPIHRPGATLYDPPDPFAEHFLPGAKARLEPVSAKQLWFDDAEGVTPEQHEAIVALYDGGIRYVDHKLGGWFDEWRASGLLDESILVVTSDHGEGLHQRIKNYGGHGGTAEEGLVVPLLLHLPEGRFGGQRVEGPTSHVDVVPTLLDLLGLDPSRRLVGTSILEGRGDDSIVYAERKKMQVVLRWPHKFVRPTSGKGGMIFNLATDPDELRPLRPVGRDKQEFAALLAGMLKAVDADQTDWFHPDDTDTQGRAMTPEEQAHLLELGYAGDK